MSKLKCWKKRLDLPYRLEYEIKDGNNILGDKGIMILQDRTEGFRPEPFDTWSVIKRQYKRKPYPGQTYKTLKEGIPKGDAIDFMKKYMKDNDVC